MGIGLPTLPGIGSLGPIAVVSVAMLLVTAIVIPLAMKLRRKRLKKKATREIMKDLFTWRYLARLVKGGEGHNKAKEELSDGIVRVNELLKQGFLHVARNTRNPYAVPWYALLGEPRSGKSSLLEAGELELVPSTEEDNPQGDPVQSLPVRFWTGANAVICDVSGKVFFDRWLEESGAEWNFIVKQLCRKKRGRILDGVILTIPADALLADDETLSSRKAVLMANELGKLLRQSGMRLPCYVAVTKLDMVSGFREYAKAFTGDMRHQILGFESDADYFDKNTFAAFWDGLADRLRAGAKQLLFPVSGFGGGQGESRMDMAGKIWLFPDNFAALHKNLKVYLDALFGEDNFHGTKNTFLEGVYFTSARDQGFSFSPGVASLAGRAIDDVPIPVSGPGSEPKDQTQESIPATSTALVVVNTAKTLIAPHLKKRNRLQGYFIRDLLHRRIFVPSPNAEYVRAAAMRRHIPRYALCAVMILMGLLWLLGALFRAGEFRESLVWVESYYDWLEGAMSRGGPFVSPLIVKEPGRGFVLSVEPVEGEILSSRLQFYYDALNHRDLAIPVPLSFRISAALVFRFDRNIGYRDRAFIANQLHKTMVRIPVIKAAGAALIERVNTQTLDAETRNVITSFVSLDAVRGAAFAGFFSGPNFHLDSMIRFLVPDVSDDTMRFLTSYLPRHDHASTAQMDLGFLYSDDFRLAKDAALDIMLSSWARRDAYPDSVYGKIRTLATISEELVANHADITAALGRINGVSTLDGVEAAVFEWRRLSDRHRNLAARGRVVFDELRLLMRAAGIPLGFVAPTTSDAFGDNLINNYLFNDVVINLATREYTRLFEADMDFVRRRSRNPAALGELIAVQNAFGANLGREVETLRHRARDLRESELLSGRVGETPNDESLFMLVERILALASDIPLPRREALRYQAFEADWRQGQDGIRNAQDAFEMFVRPYAEDQMLSEMIFNARVMMLAQAFYNRHAVFTTTLSFLNTFEGNIAAVIQAEGGGGDLFSFSDDAIGGLFGGFYFDRRYDPVAVGLLANDVASFASLFRGGEGGLPLFLRNVDRNIYQPPPFMNFLESYFNYWGGFPENVYVPAGSWGRFRDRASRHRVFQINSVLHSIYQRSLDAVTQIDDAILNDSLLALRDRTVVSLGDRISLLNRFLSADAERTFSAWAGLPADPLEAYGILKSMPEDDLRATFLAVYTPPAPNSETLALGWWNAFVLDGLGILAREVAAANMTRLLANMETFQAWPLAMDTRRYVSPETMRDLATLLGNMGAEFGAQIDPDPATALLRRNLFRGPAARNWAETVWQIAVAMTDAQQPLTWTLYQAPVEVQQQLSGRGRLLAIHRFRYVETSAGGATPRISGTMMNEPVALFSGNAADGNLDLRFYMTSRDRIPGARLVIDRPWAIFELFLQGNHVSDDRGNILIPLYIEDEAGLYVHYVILEFNREIPAPSMWHSLRNWPQMVVSEGAIVERPGGPMTGGVP